MNPMQWTRDTVRVGAILTLGIVSDGFYNVRMATSRTPEDMLRDWTAAMGPKLGPAYHRLYNDNAWLHMKWNEFLKLFATSPARIRDLNTAAAGFFHQVQELWWDDLLLHVFRMTDKRPDVLSVYTLHRESSAALQPIIQAQIDDIVVPACAFASQPDRPPQSQRGTRGHVAHSRKSQRRPSRLEGYRRSPVCGRKLLLENGPHGLRLH
jgi:AbiU2